MKLIQPYPDHSSPITLEAEQRIPCPVPVFYIRYRYPHHAAASGFDRLCDYTGETIRLSYGRYLLGETVFRIPAVIMARLGGNLEYSRYDYVLEQATIAHFRKHKNSIYHFVYGGKNYNMLARWAGTNDNKIVLTIHHPVEDYHWMFKSIDHFRLVTHITVVSRNMLSFWKEFLGKEKVSYIPYAVDTDYFVPLAEIEKRKKKKCIFIGSHKRDFETLSFLVRNILKRNKETEFHMICPDTRCRCISSSFERAFWHRKLDDNTYKALLSESDVMVLPLKASTTSTAVLEAMSSGLPIITNEGGIEDYLNSDCCRVFPVGDAVGMSDATLEVLENEKLRTFMSQAARKTALEFSWPNTVRKMIKLYVSIADHKHNEKMQE